MGHYPLYLIICSPSIISIIIILPDNVAYFICLMANYMLELNRSDLKESQYGMN